MSAPPTTAEWSRRQQPAAEPSYGTPAKTVSPRRLSRREVEALYWQTQRLRQELAAQKRYLGFRDGSPHGSRSLAPYPAHGRSRSVSPAQPRAASVYDGYGSTRSLSLPRSPHAESLLEALHAQQQFVRGAPHRNTVAAIRSATPTIYEEYAAQQQAAQRDAAQRQSGQPTPIFKRGSLQRVDSAATTPSSTAPKRVSFTGSNRDSGDSEVFFAASPNYANVPEAGYGRQPRRGQADAAPERPLPPLPPSASGETSGSNSSVYGVVTRRPRQQVASPRRHTSPASPLSPAARWQQQQQSESESGSEAGEVQRILGQHQQTRRKSPTEEEWAADGKSRGPGADQSGPGGGGGAVSRDDSDLRSRGGGGGGSSGGRSSGGGRSRDDPRRHTLSGAAAEHHSMAAARSMDLESPLPRGYPPLPSLFDEDPGIMSEVETSSTGFRRGGKQRSSLPVVRTPSKTLERPLGKGGGATQLVYQPYPVGPHVVHHVYQLPAPPRHHHGHHQHPAAGGLVFLQYRNETKRALLPNEITSLDTVKALFVRSFPKQLTMEYLDSPVVKIYIHDSSKDMFYELEDLRSHLRDIRDRSVLRLFEATDVSGGVLPGAGVGLAPPAWDHDQSYFSEPEFDSDYHHQHIHKSKTSSKSSGGAGGAGGYYMTHSYPPGGPATLPRGGPLLRAAYSAPKTADRLHSETGYMSSPERAAYLAPSPSPYGPPAAPGASSAAAPYEDPYYGQYGPRSGSITPVIDEEARIRVEHMERQLANLTGLVQKALTQAPSPAAPGPAPAAGPTPAPRDYGRDGSGGPQAAPRDNAYRNDDTYLRSDTKPPKLGKDKSVSFEKSVSFSDEPPDMNSPKQHSPQHSADSKPTKPAIKSSTLPRMSSQERDRHKPAPPPKPVSLSPGQYDGRHVYRADLQLTPETYNQLRGLQKKARDLRQEVRNLRRMSQAQAHSVRETIRDTFIKIRAMLLTGGEEAWAAGGDAEKLRLSREEDLYKQEMLRLEKDLTELESTVEELRGNVINRKTRVNMSDVENMALVLSKSSKTVADLKVRFPSLQEGMKSLLSSEMEKVVREEKFLKEEPERLESALRRCKKLTGTLVTLKRLASVQEQRLPPDTRLSPTPDSDVPVTPPAHGKAGGGGNPAVPARGVVAAGVVAGRPGAGGDDSDVDGAASRGRPENALDALLDELQTFARPPAPPPGDVGRKGSVDSGTAPPQGVGLRRLHSYPSSADGPPPVSPKPPVPERNAELLSQLAAAGRRVPPPPPPRTSSRSPLASPTSPSLPPRGGTLRRSAPGRGSLRGGGGTQPPQQQQPQEASNSSSCESVNSQEGLATVARSRKEVLEQRHQELLRKQRALQEQYARLQQLQRAGPGGGPASATPDLLLLKKTGSESNLLAKMGLGAGLATMSGSLTHLAAPVPQPRTGAPEPPASAPGGKIYETDIL